MANIEYAEWGYRYPASNRPVLSAVNLSLDQAQFTLVIGESGSGKSTFVRALNGLVPHFTGGRVSGRLRVCGLDPVSAGPSSMALRVGMVFQDPESQFVLDTVEDEIAFAMENAAVPRDDMRRRVDDTLALLDIERLRQRAIHTLSGGEQQRVAIASALVLRPSVLVLDEPTSQLDPEAAAGVLDVLSDLNRSGLAVVLVEHRLERVLPFANNVVRVADGAATAGAPSDMLREATVVPPAVELARALGMDPLPLTPQAVAAAVREHPAFAGLFASQPKAGISPVVAPGAERLALKGVRAGYGDCMVLQGVDLVVREGEIVALIGQNGHGKSTLLKTILGLVKPAAGEVWVDGKPVTGSDPAAISQNVAYLPQNPNALLYADTVVDEFDTTRRNHGLPRLTPAEADQWLRQLRLSGYAGAYPRDLSVGERERVAIGAVTVTRPKLILLDEPTRGLDYTSKRALSQMLHDWQQDGCAVVVVSHDVEFIAECATRVVVMNKGNIADDGRPADVLRHGPIFTPQIAQAFPESGWITVADALAALAAPASAIG